ncbi:DinB family protein [Sutcliffiella horikoshii]|uniref:DinB family protein n=1 Tax=Sutcliffiella horikoshii TaxID=79883 RepID=UPI001F35FD7A|nr:DinB family protein [Sutcliffiella horikoshii]MCG1023384.1 DinB family protein [Sutcliffiella horikoshii]
MTHAKEVLANQLLANANDTSWYVSLEEALEGLKEEEAFWKPNEDSNSIAEIVWHLLFWNNIWQKRYRAANVKAVPSVENNEESFILPKGYSFDRMKSELLEGLLAWQEILTEEKLDGEATGFPVEAKWWHLISNATTHNAYHIGQILYIRKLQGSWKKCRTR